MNKGFLAREFDRALASGKLLLNQEHSTVAIETQMNSSATSSDSLRQQTDLGTSRWSRSDNSDCCSSEDHTQSSGISQENVAFFEHNAEFELPPTEREVNSLLSRIVSRGSGKRARQETSWLECPAAVTPIRRASPSKPLSKRGKNCHQLPSGMTRKKITRINKANKPPPNEASISPGFSSSMRQAKLDQFLLKSKRRSQTATTTATTTATMATTTTATMATTTTEAANVDVDAFSRKTPPTSLEITKSLNFSAECPRELNQNVAQVPPNCDTPRSQLADDFVISVKLTLEEERLFLSFKYMFDAAAKRLNDAPLFPMGLGTFRSSMLEVRLNSTNSQIEYQSLLQALCAGRCTSRLLRGQALKLPRAIPDWAKLLPESLPNTVLKELSKFLVNRNMVIVLPEDSLSDLHDFAQQLRALGTRANYAAGPVSWDRMKSDGTWLINAHQCPDGWPQIAIDGVILPTNLAKWPGFVCGTLVLDVDSQWVNLKPLRTAFVDNRLRQLSDRLLATNNLKIDCRPLDRYGVDLCTADLGVIFTVKDQSLQESAKDVIVQLVQRVLRAAQFFRHVVLIQLSLTPAEYLKKLIEFVAAKASYTGCQFQVVVTSGEPVEKIVSNICEFRGNDISDFAFSTVRNSTLADILAEENPDQNPHAVLVRTIL